MRPNQTIEEKRKVKKQDSNTTADIKGQKDVYETDKKRTKEM